MGAIHVPRLARAVVAGRAVRYQVVEGTGDAAIPLLLIHGIACSSFAFGPTLEHLAAARAPRTTFAPDMPGYGRSQGPRRALDIAELAAWTADFLDVVGVPRAHVVGNSMGCQVALALARQAPARVASLVVIGPTTGDEIVPLSRYAVGLAVDSAFESLAYNLTLARMFLQMGARRYAATLRHMLRDHPIAAGDAVRCPTLVVRGARDKIVSDRVCRRLADAVQRGRFVRIPGVAHAVQFDRPDALWAAALPFIAAAERDDG